MIIGVIWNRVLSSFSRKCSIKFSGKPAEKIDFG